MGRLNRRETRPLEPYLIHNYMQFSVRKVTGALDLPEPFQAAYHTPPHTGALCCCVKVHES